MPKLPQISGRHLVAALRRLGYVIQRTRGSHVRMMKPLRSGEHHITVPLHNVLDKGTLHAILADVASHNNIRMEEILDLL